jgi:hypothetical protein
VNRQPSSDETGGGFFMSKCKSDGRAAEPSSHPQIICILTVDNMFDEFEVEIFCQRTNGVDRGLLLRHCRRATWPQIRPNWQKNVSGSKSARWMLERP